MPQKTEKPSEKRAVVLDIDGTFLDPRYPLILRKDIDTEYEGLLHFLNRLPPRKVRFTFATGRAYAGIKKILSQAAQLRAFRPPRGFPSKYMPIILYNGALIAGSDGFTIYKKWEIPKANCQQIIQKALDYGLSPFIYWTSQVFSLLREKVFSISGFSAAETDTYNELKVEYVPDVADIKIDGVVAILLFGASSLDHYERTKLLSSLGNYATAKLFGDRIEVSPLGSNKGVALCELARLLKWNINYIMAVGDNVNDVDMFKVAGIGVALDNAPPDVKILADHVTKYPYGRGVAESFYKGIIAKEWRVKLKNG